MALPTKFEDLGVAELRRSAVEDFAAPAGPTDNKQMVLAALLDAGVTWADYVAQHPEVVPVPEAPVVVESVTERIPEPSRGGAITTGAMEAPVNIITARAPAYDPQDKLLIKMERENERFDVAGLTFTKQRPYCLASPEKAEYIMNTETGFRQAYPSELQEFYRV